MKEKLKRFLRPSEGRSWKSVGIWSAFILLAPLTYALVQWAYHHSHQVEMVYSRKIYPVISQIWGYGSRIVPISIAELLLYIGSIGMILWTVWTIVNLIRKGNKAYRLIRYCSIVLAVTSVMYFLFYALWGFNYYREPIGVYLGLDTQDSSVDELYALCDELVSNANRLRQGLDENEDGTLRLPYSDLEGFSKVPSLYNKLKGQFPQLSGNYCAPKMILASNPMNDTNINGIFMPFTYEPNVNVTVPDLLLMATACHEAAHQRGIAREDEANFIGYLACQASDDPYIQYSGTVLALIYSTNQLNDADSQLFSQLWSQYSDGLIRDLRQHNQFIADHEGKVAETSNQVNDHYLQSNKQTDGVKSYGRMVDLLLAYRRQQLSKQ